MKSSTDESDILISAVIVSYNAKHFLERCLLSLLSEKEKGFEIVLVDDGSTDGTTEFVKSIFPKEEKLKIISLKENCGAAQAKNIGAKACHGQYLLFLDSDTKIKPGWFEQTLIFFQNNPEAGLAQAKLLKMGTDLFDYAGDLIGPFGFLIERARSAKDQGQFDEIEPIFGLKTAGALMRKDVFDELGGFDSDYRIFWEDTDLAWRTRLRGFQILFCPAVTVWHAYGTPEKTEKHYLERQKAYQITYFGCRNMICSLVKNLELKSLAIILPINISCWIILAGLFLLKLNAKKSLEIFRGLAWNLFFLKRTLGKRKRIQASRKVSDQEIFSLVGAKKNPGYYLGKALAYIQNKPF